MRGARRSDQRVNVLMGPGAIRELHPFYNLDDVRAALWTPEDGHVDPAGAAFALAAGARQRGTTVVRHNRVTGRTSTGPRDGR